MISVLGSLLGDVDLQLAVRQDEPALAYVASSRGHSRTVICEWGIVHSDGASWDFSKCVEIGEFAPSLRLFEAINRLRHAKGGIWDQLGSDLNGDPYSETVNQLG